MADIKGTISNSTHRSQSSDKTSSVGVASEHVEYTAHAARRAKVNDTVGGQDVIKAAKTSYLPKLNPDDKSNANTTRYESYLARAVFYNTTRRTKNSLVGLAFKKDPTLEVPAELDYILDDIDGNGVSIFQQSKGALGEIVKIGRGGLLVDFPQVEGDTSKDDMDINRATCNFYPSDSLINWRTTRIGAVHKLSLLVISESHTQISDDGFSEETLEQYRALRLTRNPLNPDSPDDGVYYVEIYRPEKEGGTLELVESYIPAQGNGAPWEEMPFTFIGSENNDPSTDDEPLYDLAELNLAHYRNSADYEDSTFFMGQVQPWVTGLDDEWRDWLVEQGMYIGSRNPLLLPAGAAFGMEQAQENSMVKEAMTTKEAQMVALGARLIEKGSAVKTATQAQHENEAETSQLALIAGNVSEAYEMALGWMLNFQNVNGEAFYELNQDFTEYAIDAQTLTAYVNLWQSGTAPLEDIQNRLKASGIIDPEKTAEQLSEEIEAQAPAMGGGLDLDDEETE